MTAIRSASKKIRSLLVANRGEIAIGGFHRASEGHFATRHYKADDSEFVGEGQKPIGASLDIPGMIRIAKGARVDAIHSGYGGLSENPDFAQAFGDAGISFITPRPKVTRALGNQVTARELAIKSGVSVAPASGALPRGLEAVPGEGRRLGSPVMPRNRGGGQLDNLESRLIGRSPQMAKVRQLILDVAGAAVDVLIFGETGTGKEMVARCLHDLSHPGQQNYVALNCGGMSDNLLDSELFGHEPGAFTGAQKRRIGKIEYASGGTLFLDEVESMPMTMQIKLLRVLQERVIERLGSNQQIPVSCRVIAATKEDLRLLSDQGKFRADLYYRLNVVRIELPPLRERREDIPALYDQFLLQAAKRYNRPPPALTSECLRRLMAQDWPGNIRELRNAADCHALGIGLDAVASSTASAPQSLTEAVDNYERLLITREFTLQDGNIGRTSAALKVARTTLHGKLKKYALI